MLHFRLLVEWGLIVEIRLSYRKIQSSLCAPDFIDSESLGKRHIGHHVSDFNGEVREGFLEEMILGLSSKGVVGKKCEEKIRPGRESSICKSPVVGGNLLGGRE